MSFSCENITASFNMTMIQNMTIVLLLFIIVFFTGPLGSTAACMYKAVGDTFVIPLNDVGEEIISDSSLFWTHDETRVYVKKGSTVKQKIYNINTKGSLIVEDVKIIQSGKYTAQVYNKDGKLLKEAVIQLCVRDPVLEPTVTVKCEENEAVLTCQASNNTEMTVIWMKNEEKLNVPNTVLHVNSSELKRGHRFSCTVRNEISEKTSKHVQSLCFHTGPQDTKNSEKSDEDRENTNDDSSEKKYLFGMDLWWFLVFVTGGGILLLVLIIICFICVFSCRKRAKEEEEYQLAVLVSDESGQKDSERSERLSKSQRPLPPVPSPVTPPYM